MQKIEGLAKVDLINRDLPIDLGNTAPPVQVDKPIEAPPPIAETKLRNTTAEDRAKLVKQSTADQIKSKLEELNLDTTNEAAMRRALAELDRGQLQKLRPLLLDRLSGDALAQARAHPATHGPATVEKLIAIASCEASQQIAEKPGKELVKWAEQAIDAFSKIDLGSGRLIDVHDRDLWVHRVCTSEDLRAIVAPLDEGAALFFEAAKHLGFEAAMSAELHAVWPELESWHAIAPSGVAAIAPYLEEHGIERTAWALVKVSNVLDKAGPEAERLALEQSFEALAAA